MKISNPQFSFSAHAPRTSAATPPALKSSALAPHGEFQFSIFNFQSSPQIQRSSRAFTLIEVLLALAICAIVLVAINAVYATAVRLRNKTSIAVDEAAPINQTFEILRRDLKSTVGPGGFLAGDFKCGAPTMGASMGLSGEAGGSGLDFFTATGQLSDSAPWGDLQEVFYELKTPADRYQAGMDLVRCVNRNILSTGTQTPDIQYLMSHVETLQFDCYDGTQWRNTWDTSSGDTNLPTAVRVRIQLAAKEGDDTRGQEPLELVVPLMSQTTRTNANANANSGATQ
jgi:type II secretion system protein J